MKSICLTLSAALAVVISACVQTNGHTQTLSHAAVYRTSGTISTIDSSSAIVKPGYINNISVAATRDFIRRFNDPANARWFKVPDGGFVAKFEIPDINYRVAYTSRGIWVYTIQTYYEKKLPRDVRARVKSTYYDDAIVQVEQIEHVDAVSTVYIVHLKDEKGWKLVRLCDGEMDIIQTITKR